MSARRIVWRAAPSADGSRAATDPDEVQPTDLDATAPLRPPQYARARAAQTKPESADHRTTLAWPGFQPAQVAQFHPAPTAALSVSASTDGRTRPGSALSSCTI